MHPEFRYHLGSVDNNGLGGKLSAPATGKATVMLTLTIDGKPRGARFAFGSIYTPRAYAVSLFRPRTRVMSAQRLDEGGRIVAALADRDALGREPSRRRR